MNAGRLLRQTGYDSPGLRARLAPVDPDRVNIWPASPVMQSLWRPGIQGVTIRNMVFVDPELMRGDRTRLARLVIHELVHVSQFAKSGYFPYMARYLYEYFQGRLSGKDRRQAYLDISAEVEAREVAARAHRFS